MIPSHLIHELLRRGLESDASLTPYDIVVYSAIARIDPQSYEQIRSSMNFDRTTVMRSVKHLQESGWIHTEKIVPRTKCARTRFILSAPPATQKAIARTIEEFRWRAPRAGEFLMLTWLDLLVVPLHFQNNARLKCLANPSTGYPMEVDRFYVDEGIGFEFNGRQHYEETELHSDVGHFQAQQTRDHVKKSLCMDEGITLITVTENDLSHEGILAKARPHIRTRRIDLRGQVVRAVARLSDEYIASCNRARRRVRLTSAKSDIDARPQSDPTTTNLTEVHTVD